jgi:heme/copper-type cytochrome/quinol oxidase subunit 4/mono/diheme cytochrome c family protein
MSAHHSEEQHEGRHPSFKQYVVIAIILFAITLVEFLIIVPQSLRGSSLVVAPLFILSILKFAIVIMFYMHLKFDPKMFTTVFLAGLFLGLMVVSAVLFLFGSFQPTPRDYALANAVPYVPGEEGHGTEPAVTEPAPPVSEIPAPPGTPDNAVSPPPSAPTAGGAAAGQEIFLGKGLCSTCHTIEGVSAGILGPALDGIASVAGTRQPGVSAEEYFRESIKEPDAFINEGCVTGAGAPCAPGVMAALVTAANLTDAEVDALVAFLMTQQ